MSLFFFQKSTSITFQNWTHLDFQPIHWSSNLNIVTGQMCVTLPTYFWCCYIFVWFCHRFNTFNGWVMYFHYVYFVNATSYMSHMKCMFVSVCIGFTWLIYICLDNHYIFVVIDPGTAETTLVNTFLSCDVTKNIFMGVVLMIRHCAIKCKNI